MPFRRRFGGRTHGAVPKPRVPKAPKVKAPKPNKLSEAYKSYLAATVDARVQALYEAINWWDAAIDYALSKSSMPADKISTYERANKARALGMGAGATADERETALVQCIRQYEKIWPESILKRPSIDVYLAKLKEQLGDLQAKESSLKQRFQELLDMLNGVFSKFGISYTVQKSKEAREFDGLGHITLSTELAKVLVQKMRGEGVLSVLFSEATVLLQAASVDQDASGGHFINVVKTFETLPLVLQSILAHCETVPRSKVFKAAPTSLEATVADTVAKPQRAPRVVDPNKPKVTRAKGNRVGGRYAPGCAMAMLYERLASGKPMPTSELFKGIAANNPAERLKWLVRHGADSGKWTITWAGNTVQMVVH